MKISKKIFGLTSLGLAVALLTAGCSHSESSETYDAPGALEVKLPVANNPVGTILDSEKLSLGSDAVGYRILYTSRSLKEQPIAVSGYVVTPSGNPPAGGWPLIAWAHGTTGLGDSCAPSINVEDDRTLWEGLTDAGYAVVATDYEGLGTPGLHPYVVGESEARGVFDSVRAVQNHDGDLKGIEVSDGWVAWGHSQGGHATMFVAEIWKDYAANLNLLGSVAGAPPSQFSLLYDALLGGAFQGYIVMATAGAAESYDLVLEDVLAPTALEPARIAVLESGCTQEIFDQYNNLTAEELSPFGDPLNEEPTKDIIAKMDPANFPIQTPLLIIHGEADEQIPTVSSLALMLQQCAMKTGIPIKRLTYPDQMHSQVVQASISDMLDWIGDRFAGVPAETDCPS